MWCPSKGIRCNEVGENRFMFTFLQESGKRKVIDNGPWMFDKELVVIEEYVPSKRLEDYEFNNIPIWVRVFNLPLGMMNEDSAEEIGNIIGLFMEADTGADGWAIGKFMRIKIK
ncbi:LRR receptor-like serine/threonine-protein kinase FLS2 [Hordeum vulgare]|nr:LRR receptor-like serine/threonine-protein kinase FLS2 [Hordeum vulgare]